MKSGWNPLVIGGCNVLGLALLALSVTAGGSAVRAAGDAAGLDSVALEPLMKLADGFQQRVAKVEAAVASLADAVTAKRIAAQELCVADASGAQTCITKAQLDVLLKGALQTAQAAPATVPPAAQPPQAAPAPETATEPRSKEQPACPEKCVAPDTAVIVVPEVPPAVTETASPGGAGAPAREPAPPAAAAVPPPAPPASDQHQTAAEAPAASATVAPEPVESVIATVAKVDSAPSAPAPAKAEEPAPASATGATPGSVSLDEPKVTEAPSVPEHKE
jgi:hypothetical protein